MRWHRDIVCPRCGAQVVIPKLWVVGVEIVFRCPACSRPFKTGYKMGALLFALALTLALGTANIMVWLFSSVTTPFFALMIVPLWILYGFVIRRWYLGVRIRRARKRARRDNEAS